MGLFDYLGNRIAKTLLLGLYNRLAPGGLLVISNATSQNNNFWFIEFVLDWTLKYRTKEEILELGADLPNATLNIKTEPSNGYALLLIRKETG